MDLSVHNPYSELFSAYIYLLSDLKINAVHFNSGHTISKKRFCLFINKLNVVKEKAFSEAGFCTLAQQVSYR